MSNSIDAFLPYLSFALSLGGLAAQLFLSSSPRKSVVLLIVATCLVVITGMGWYEVYSHARNVEEVSAEIVTALGTDTMTFDELYQALFKVDLGVATEALDALVRDKRVGHKLLEARDSSGNSYTFRAYYLSVREDRASIGICRGRVRPRGGRIAGIREEGLSVAGTS